MKNLFLTLLICSLTSSVMAQHVGINTNNPQEQLHLRSDSVKLALRMDSKKSAAGGFNYFTVTVAPASATAFEFNPEYQDWTDLNHTKLLQSDDVRMNGPQLELVPDFANPLRVQFAAGSTIPSNAQITDVTVYAEWRRIGTYAGNMGFSLIINKASNHQPLLVFGPQLVSNSTDLTQAITYQSVINPITPDMINLGDFYLHFFPQGSYVQGLSRLEIDRIWVEIEYKLPATNGTNVFWSSGVKEGQYRITNSPNLNTNLFLSIDENGVTQLKGLKLAKNAGAGKVLMSNNEGRAYWAELPSVNVNRIDDLLDGKSDASNLFVGSGSGDSLTSGQHNAGFGYHALSQNTSGQQNTAIGNYALQSNTIGLSNTALGFLSLSSNINGANNTAVGGGSMNENLSGGGNTAVGTSSLGDNITGNNNTGLGYNSLRNNTSGLENTAAGAFALRENTLGQYNVAVGSYSLENNTSGDHNVGLGRFVMKGNTTGENNSSVGSSAMFSNTTGSNNTVMGKDALYFNVANSRSTAIGYRAMCYADDDPVGRETFNTAIGYEALLGHYSKSINTGAHNTAIGDRAMLSNTSGSYNTAAGSEALKTNTTGEHNTAIGRYAMTLNTTGYNNTAIGNEALYLNTTGYNNTAIGRFALFQNVGNIGSTAIGYQAMFNASNAATGISTRNTAVGNQALFGSPSVVANTGTANTAIGHEALFGNANGSFNTAVGAGALLSNEENSRSTAIGYYAMRYAANLNVPYSTYNTAVGYGALQGSGIPANNFGTYNTAVGDVALTSNTSGSNNTAVGAEALFDNTIGGDNIAVGRRAMFANTTGNDNVSLGSFSMFDNTSGSLNVAVGFQSMLNNTAGSSNVAVGWNAMSGNTTGNSNTSIGAFAGENMATGVENTGVGKGALQHNATGSQNSALGHLAGPSSTAVVTNQCTFLGNGSGLSTSRSNVTMLGFGANGNLCTGDNQVILGNGFVTQLRAAVSSITAYSDERFKYNVQDNVSGLDFINRLRPVTYQHDPFKLNEILDVPDSLYVPVSEADRERRFIGFLAQEVEAAAQASGFDFPGLDTPENDHQAYALRYGDFIMPMTKAIQELSEENEILKVENQKLLDRLNALETEVQQIVAELTLQAQDRRE